MFWINIIFWIITILSIAISSRLNSYSYSSLSYKDYSEAGNFEAALYSLMREIRRDSWDIGQMVNEYYSMTQLNDKIKDRWYGKLTVKIARYANKDRRHLELLTYVSVMLSYIFYDSVLSLFSFCCFITVFGHLHYSYLLDYMDSPHKLVYYALPLSVFSIALLIGVKFFKQEIGWPLARIAFIIAFIISFPIAIVYNDWSNAYQEYAESMEEEFGEDWEDELEDAQYEHTYRTR